MERKKQQESYFYQGRKKSENKRPRTSRYGAINSKNLKRTNVKRDESSRQSIAQLVEDQKARHQEMYDSMTKLQ